MNHASGYEHHVRHRQHCPHQTALRRCLSPTLIFDQFVVSAGPNVPESAAVKSCRIDFGNSTTPLVTGAETSNFNDVVIMELPDTDDEGTMVAPLPDP